ncbi:hypothetical protein FRC06_011730 [Ceratobasidium sp. 370]|nr:hypothetical protein FRC06_011730 [Ceratobasidium sp. 370]
MSHYTNTTGETDIEKRAFPVYHRKLGNPTPLGLFSFASTTLILSLYNAGARDINVPNVVVSMTMGVGGLCQLLAGMWEFATGNTFGATGKALVSGSGILDAYAGSAGSQLPSALGIYLTTWAVVTFIMLMATFKSSVALVSTFFVLLLTFMLLAISEFTGSLGATKAGGVLGCIAACLALYTGAAGLYSPDASYFVLPVGSLVRND